MQYQIHQLTTKKQPQYKIELSLKLKQKKKSLISAQTKLKQQIKSHFTQITNTLMDRENILIKQVSKSILSIFQQIHYYQGMSDAQRNCYTHEIKQLFNKQLEISSYQLNNIQKFINKSFQVSFIDTTLPHDHHQINQDVLIEKLQTKIQKMMVREQKLNNKITQLQSKYHIKEQNKDVRPIWNLKVQRLQAQNQILKQINQSCSTQILQITQENIKLKNNIQKPQLIQSIQYSIQNDTNIITFKQKINKLNDQIIELKNQNNHLLTLNNQLTNDNITQKSYIMQLQRINTNQSNQIHILNQNNTQIYRDYELNCKKKVQMEESFNQSQKAIQQLKTSCNDLKHSNAIKQAQIANLKNIKAISELTNQKLQKQLQFLIEKQTILKKQLQKKKEELLQCTLQKDQQIFKLKQKLTQMQKKYMKKLKELQQKNNQVQKIKQENIHHISQIQEEMKNHQKKQKSTYRKSVNKTMKNLEKQHQQIKKQMISDFNNKYLMLQLQVNQLRSKLKQIEDLSDNKVKIAQNTIKNLKQRFYKQIQEMIEKGKGKITSDIIEKYIQSSSTIALKNSQIKQLKDQILLIKKGKLTQSKLSINDEKNIQGQILQLQKQFINTKSQLTVQIMKEKVNECLLELQQKNKSIEKQNKIIENEKVLNSQFKQQLISLKKIIKTKQTQLEEIYKKANLMSKNELEIEITKVKKVANDFQNQYKDIKQQLEKKKELINQYKKNIKQKDQQIKIIKSQLQIQFLQGQKIKKNIKDIYQKQQSFKQIKQKLENMKQLEKQNQNLKKTLQQKQKLHKYQINKKDQLIRNVKIQNQQYKVDKDFDKNEEIQNLKEQKRKLKNQIDRKDQLIKHYKQKIQKQNQELQQKIMKYQIQIKKIKMQNDSIEKKLQNTKINLKKQESKKIILLNAIRKIYQKVINKYSSNHYLNVGKTQSTPNKYAQGLSILQLTMEDLQIQNQQGKQFSKDNLKSYLFNLEKVLQEQDLSVNIILNLFQQFLKVK